MEKLLQALALIETNVTHCTELHGKELEEVHTLLQEGIKEVAILFVNPETQEVHEDGMKIIHEMPLENLVKFRDFVGKQIEPEDDDITAIPHDILRDIDLHSTPKEGDSPFFAALRKQYPGVFNEPFAPRIEANHGRSFEIFTASNPDALRGGQWDYAVFDDPARMPESIWTQFVWPCLPLHGQADFIGIPQGIHNSDGTENWFHRIFQQGLDPFLPDWMSSILPTTSSPEVLQEMIEEARKNLPELVFRQEYLAEFIDPQEK